MTVDSPLPSVAVIGAGAMGSGIAQIAAQAASPGGRYRPGPALSLHHSGRALVGS
jgi:3-hydroxyisobutyrate dehydrogenase-like beta-hydroxyacid dehydrogenase